jgi:phospholipid/cholesterol/gamma-HCH transport system substrate-binding protein
VNKDRPGPGKILIIAGFALSCFGLLLFLWLAFGGPTPLKPQGYRFKASFEDAATLADQADVRIAGVSVGKVVDLERDPRGNRMLATMQMESRFAPVASDARALLRQKTLLGETYVELTRGSRDADPVPENGTLADSQVQKAVLFDQFFSMFDDETRKAFQEWQATLAKATEGTAQDFNDVLGNLPVFIENARGTVDTLDDRREALSQLIRNTGRTFGALSRNQQALQTLIVRNTQTFESLAEQREALAESIQIFPTFLRESRTTLRRLGQFSEDTEPLLRDLEPVLQDARPTIRALAGLSPDLRRLFRDLDPLIDASREGLPALSRVLRGLDPTLASIGPFLQQVNPLLEFFEARQVQISDFFNVGPNALAGRRSPSPGTSSLGHVLPQLIITGSESIPTLTRSPTNRGNTYIAPEDLPGPGFRSGHYIFPNWDCAHIGGPRFPDDNNPGCILQRPRTFQGKTTKYPRVLPSRPGGISLQPPPRQP